MHGDSECITNNCIELILFSEELYTTRPFTNIYNTQKIQVVLLGTKHTVDVVFDSYDRHNLHA